MKTTIVLVTVCGLVAGTSATAFGQSSDVLVETDPMTFVLGGYSAHARVAPTALRGWAIGAGVYAMDLPDAMVDINAENRDEGWNARLSFGAGVFADYQFAGSTSGAFVGVQAAIQRYRLTRDSMSGKAEYTAGLIMARLGYQWFPSRTGFYVMPWLGVGATTAIAGERQVGAQTYDVFPVVAFATLHAGWRF